MGGREGEAIHPSSQRVASDIQSAQPEEPTAPMRSRRKRDWRGVGWGDVHQVEGGRDGADAEDGVN